MLPDAPLFMNRLMSNSMQFLINVGITTFIIGCSTQQTLNAANAGQSSTEVNFSNCEVKVQFTGQAREFNSNETLQLTGSLPKYGKWRATASIYEESRLTEWAACLCRDYPFTDAEKFARPGVFQANASGRDLRIYDKTQIGSAFEFESPESNPTTLVRVRVSAPASAPSCLLLQGVAAPESKSVARLFLEHASPSNHTKPELAQAQESSSALLRLKRLDQLLDEKLITRDEYDQRRKIILDQL